MEWLNTYAFPRETGHSDSQVATREYKKLCSRLAAHGTTTALIFGTIYKEACQRLALCLQAQGLRGFVGKVCMDRSVNKGPIIPILLAATLIPSLSHRVQPQFAALPNALALMRTHLLTICKFPR